MRSLATVLLSLAAATQAALPRATQGTVIFEDDFNTLDLKHNWRPEITMGGGGNWEFEFYSNNRTTSYVQGGNLYLQPRLLSDMIGEANVQNGFTLDAWGLTPASQCTSNMFYGCLRTSGAGGNILNPILSAKLTTATKFSFTYGLVEIRAKLPRGDWLWPAIWLLPEYEMYGGWPASGEIDVIESRGNDPSYGPGGVDTVASTLHWGPYPTADQYPQTTKQYKLSGTDFSQDFHVFGCLWNATTITTYVDDPSNVILSVPTANLWNRGGWSNSTNNPWTGGSASAPFDQDFYLILNVAVGGTGGYFPDSVGNKPWANTSPNAVNEFYQAINQWYPTWAANGNSSSAMVVDYVRVTSLS